MLDKRRRMTAEEMQELTPAQRRRMHRRRAKRRMLVRLFTLLLVCLLVVTLWKNWDAVAPDKWWGNLQDSLAGSTGRYPVDVSGVNMKRLTLSGKYTVTFSDSYLTYLDDNGGEVVRYACTYPSGLLSTAGQYVLLAEQDGRRFRLNTRSGVVFEGTAEYPIITAAVNAKGQMALLTQGPQGYTVQVIVYDRRGKVLYTRSRNQQAVDVALSADGSQVGLLSVQATDGTLYSIVDVFSLSSTDTKPVCSHTVNNMLLYRLEYLGDTWLTAIGESGAVMLDTKDGLSTVYSTGGMRLLGYAIGDNTLALALRPYGDTGDGQVQVVNKKGEPSCTVPFSGEFRQLSSNGKRYVLLTDSAVTEITAAGQGKQAAVDNDGQQAVLTGHRVVVLGLNRVQAYDLK
ncbi:MAG: hypothetical protein II363_02285 [Clostridia bacterium]|nr:hypothetical protein [Loktanella sp.]MBQ1950412.1 hypothetical protein [Clostridia bacterium]